MEATTRSSSASSRATWRWCGRRSRRRGHASCTSTARPHPRSGGALKDELADLVPRYLDGLRTGSIAAPDSEPILAR